MSLRCITTLCRWFFQLVIVAGLSAGYGTTALGEEAQWIWSPEHKKDAVPGVACHFRKSFTSRGVESAQITIAADDTYELFVNGRRVGQGESAQKLDKYDITRFISRGRNIISIKVVNEDGPTAAVAARVSVKPTTGNWTSYSTDGSWKTSLNPFPLWNTSLYNDSRWPAAQVFGALGETVPWDRAKNVAKTEQHKSKRFRVIQSSRREDQGRC